METKERRSFFDWQYSQVERRRSNKQWAVILLLSIPFFLFCERYVVGVGCIKDISMLPTLTPGKYFLVNKYSVRFSGPRRGDVVVVRPENHPRWHYVKRVIGLGGENLSISQGRVIINGRPLEEPYIREPTEPEMKPLQIPEGSYFLMGDNRSNSEDSRSFGSVPRNRVEGKIKPGRFFSLW